MSSSDFRLKRLHVNQARKLVTKILKNHPGNIFYSRHCLQELQADNLTTADILNILKSPDARITDQPEHEGGSYRYRLRTNKIMVVIAFDSPTTLIVVTAWRVKK